MSKELTKTYWSICLCGDSLGINYGNSTWKQIKPIIKQWDKIHADHPTPPLSGREQV